MMINRRTFLRTGIGLTAATAVGRLAWPERAATAAGEDAPGWRTYEVVMHAEVLDPAGPSRVWLPMPLTPDTDYHRSLGHAWTGNPARTRVYNETKYGAGIFCAEWPSGERAPIVDVTYRFATHDRAVDLTAREDARGRTEDKRTLAKYLEPTRLIRTDGIVATTSEHITSGRRGEVEKARAIYEWIVENTFRDPKVRGCGIGDIRFMLESNSLGGKCADLNALFVGLARAAGIPARDVYGLRVAKSAHGLRSLGLSADDATKAQHCRAEVYLTGYGWVPVDPADVRKVVLEENPPELLPLDDPKVQRARAKLFGAWEMNWLPYNYSHDVKLPQSNGPEIGFLMYPQGETANERKDSLDPKNFSYTIKTKEL